MVNTIYLLSFVGTPRKFIIANLLYYINIILYRKFIILYSSKLCHSIIQLSFSPVSIHISVLICSYFYLFVSDRSVREICIYEKRGKIAIINLRGVPTKLNK